MVFFDLTFLITPVTKVLYNVLSNRLFCCHRIMYSMRSIRKLGR